MEMTENVFVEPERWHLDRAACYHGLRAHLQIVTWKLVDSK